VGKKGSRSNRPALKVPLAGPKPLDRWLSFAGIAASIIYWLLPNKTPSTVVLSLGFLFLLLAHPVWKFWWIEKSLIRRLAGLAVLGLGVFLFGKQTWPSDTTSDHSFPKLEGRVDEVSVGAWPWDANSSSVTIVASVKNMGAPSIASDFRLFVNVPGLPRKEAIPYYVPKGLVLKVKPTDPDPSRYFVSSDLLYEKALRNPIQTGALIRGFLAFRLDGIPFPIADNPGTAMTLSFRDVNGKLYSGTGKIGPVRNQRLIFPGMPDSNMSK
jgi:hypothetical protein